MLTGYLAQPGSRCAIVEAIELATDPGVEWNGLRYFTFGEEVYYFAERPDRERSRVLELIRAARSYPYVGVLTRIPEGANAIQARASVSGELLSTLAASAESILVGAYDDEAVLIWRPG